MSWAYRPRNISLAIAANIFVYVGTIILYGINWFFVQRIIRAQHADQGWSTPYRIIHRAGLGCLGVSLILIVISQVWRNFTLDEQKLRIFRALSLTGQTYFTIFCVAPAALMAVALLVPRTEVEKFGAGRLSNKISILFAAVAILSIGQIFRCVLVWLPQTPLAMVQSGAGDLPPFLSKACFYIFNFVTEILVIVVFALFRVDLRFHIPNRSRRAGDYTCSRFNVHQDHQNSYTMTSAMSAHGSKVESNDKTITVRPSTAPMTLQNDSTQTLHRYQSSVFKDTQTLADSLIHPSTTLGVDRETGGWTIRRLSQYATSSRTSICHAPSSSRTTLTDGNTQADDAIPPVPELPAQWPLPGTVSHSESRAGREHKNLHSC